jgi:hypothetical protein
MLGILDQLGPEFRRSFPSREKPLGHTNLLATFSPDKITF